MRYTTTSCKNCGYKTRDHEANTPDVQIGAPVLRCPKCGNWIFDLISTEYEFMTPKEQSKFTGEAVEGRGALGGMLFITAGIVMLVLGIAGGGAVGGLLAGGLGMWCGISQIKNASKISEEKIVEQQVYQSLQRTKNEKYVEFVAQIYSEAEIDREYHPFADKETFLEKYKEFETRESYVEAMKIFDEVLSEIADIESVEESTSSISINP